MKSTQNLQRRISALEAARSGALVVFVKALSGGPVASITCQGCEWSRLADEPADDFRDRVVHDLRGTTDSPLLVLVEQSLGAAVWPLMAA
jgi:hypothetical protein